MSVTTPEQAMLRARAAAKAWRAAPLRARLNGLKSLQLAVLRSMDNLVEGISKETRQPQMDALTTEVYPVLDAIRYYRRKAPKLLRPSRRKTPIFMFGSKSYVEYQPFGVVLVVAPWNFPFQLGLVPAVSALAAGNAVILKPSERLCDIHDLLRTIIAESDLPEGLLQVVTGGPDVGSALVEAHPDKIFFTGGSVVGRKVAQRAAELLIPCDLELSGKDPMIVFSDANLSRSARAAVWGGFFHSGQVCVGTERVYVESSVADAFCELVKRETENLRQSVQLDGDVGLMTVEETWHQVKFQLEDALAGGATVLAGGLGAEATPPLFPPTVLCDVTEDMAVMQEETFGPLLPITTFESEAEVVQKVNSSPFGLNASVFTQDKARGRRVASSLETGCCYINDVVRNITNMDLPFGGVKESGQGRYRGPEGLHAFTQTKAIMVSAARRDKEINWFPYEEKTIRSLKSALRFLYRR